MWRPLDTIEALYKGIPLDGTQIILVLVIERDLSKGTPRGTLADAIAVEGARIALEGLAIGRKSLGVLEEGF